MSEPRCCMDSCKHAKATHYFKNSKPTDTNHYWCSKCVATWGEGSSVWNCMIPLEIKPTISTSWFDSLEDVRK